MIAPLFAFAIDEALVEPFGATKNKHLADAVEPSNIALVKPSNDFKSPRYASTKPLP
jgi:hypothetical protein